MLISYNFLSESEPTDEQLHLLMLDVVAEAKLKAQLSNEKFMKQLNSLVLLVKSRQLAQNSDNL